MLEIKGMCFDNTIKVLYKIKEKYNHKTLQETYKYIESESIDVILDVLVISYNIANNVNLNDEEFGDVLGKNGIGFAKLAFIYKDVIESILFSGMDENEIEQLKNHQKNLKS